MFQRSTQLAQEFKALLVAEVAAEAAAAGPAFQTVGGCGVGYAAPNRGLVVLDADSIDVTPILMERTALHGPTSSSSSSLTILDSFFLVAATFLLAAPAAPFLTRTASPA